MVFVKWGEGKFYFRASQTVSLFLLDIRRHADYTGHTRGRRSRQCFASLIAPSIPKNRPLSTSRPKKQPLNSDPMCRILLTCCLSLLLAVSVFGTEKRPNFVVFLVDDLGAMDVGAYNPTTFYETPNIDRLAASGVRFTAGYAACAVCSPTRFSLMTGKYPVRNGCTDWFGARRAERFRPAPLHERLDHDETTLAEALREAGYKTTFVGKWHLGPTQEFWPENHGFDVNIGGCNLGHPPSFFAPYKIPVLEDGPQGEFLTERLTDEAIRQIKEMKGSPFLLYFSFYQVHTPLQAREALIQKYREKSKRLGLPTERSELFKEEEQNYLTDNPRLVRRVQTHPVYAAMVESLDVAVGRVVDALQAEGLWDETVVCFLSDNGGAACSTEGGPTSNAPLRTGKGWQYEGGIRVPYIIRTPGGRGGRTSGIPVTTTDIYPTLLDLAGLPLKPEQHLDGVSLKPVLEGMALPKRDLYWHYPHYGNQGGFPGGAVRDGEWKLIRRYEDGRVHLYNLTNDPSEQTDLAAVKPDQTKALADKHDRWLRSVGAKFLQEKDGNVPWRPDYLQQ